MLINNLLYIAIVNKITATVLMNIAVDCFPPSFMWDVEVLTTFL